MLKIIVCCYGDCPTSCLCAPTPSPSLFLPLSSTTPVIACVHLSSLPWLQAPKAVYTPSHAPTSTLHPSCTMAHTPTARPRTHRAHTARASTKNQCAAYQASPHLQENTNARATHAAAVLSHSLTARPSPPRPHTHQALSANPATYSISVHAPTGVLLFQGAHARHSIAKRSNAPMRAHSAQQLLDNPQYARYKRLSLPLPSTK